MKLLVGGMACAMAVSSNVVITADAPGRLSAQEREACFMELQRALRDQPGWNRIRAAEALVANGETKEVWSRLSEVADTAAPEERIGIWRVLAQAGPEPADRKAMVGRIREVFADRSARDRLHAVESLAKLRAKPTDAESELAREMALGAPALAVFPNWWLALSGDAAARKSLTAGLADADPVARLRAAFAMTHLDDPLQSDELNALLQAVRVEPEDAPYRAWIIGAVRSRATASDDRDRLTRLLEEAVRTGGEQRVQAAWVLADSATTTDRVLVRGLMNDEDVRVRIAAATAMLRTDRLSD